MSDRKKQSVYVIIGLIVAAFLGIRLMSTIMLTGAAASSDETDRSEWSTDPRVVWQYHDEPLIEKSLLGVILTHDHGVLTALDPASGRELWEQRLRGQLSNTLLHAGKIYCAASKDVWAINKVSGKVEWKTSLDNWMMLAPQISDGVIYVIAGGLWALDADSGASLWKFSPGPQLSRLVIAHGLAYLSDQDGSSLYVIRAGNN